MDIMMFDTHTVGDDAALHELLSERLNERGAEPHAAAVDANGEPLLVWLYEVGGDATYVSAAVMVEPDYSETPTPEVVADPRDLEYPLSVFLRRHASGALAGES